MICFRNFWFEKEVSFGYHRWKAARLGKENVFRENITETHKRNQCVSHNVPATRTDDRWEQKINLESLLSLSFLASNLSKET